MTTPLFSFFGTFSYSLFFHLTRRVAIQAKYLVPHEQDKNAGVIYVVSSDKQSHEPNDQYLERSNITFTQRLGEISGSNNLPQNSTLAIFHVVPSSFNINHLKEAEVFGGHIASMLVNTNNFSIVPHSMMSKITRGQPLTLPKDTHFLAASSVITLKNQDYAYKAAYHSYPSASLFLTGIAVDKKAYHFGSRQYVVIIPLEHLTITAETIIENIRHYKESEAHQLYSRLTDSCGHAVMAAFGIKIDNNMRGLTPQAAMLNIGLKFHSGQLQNNFLDKAAQSGLAQPPDEVYENRANLLEFKISGIESPSLSSHAIKPK